MNKLNGVKKLNRSHAHRKAMVANMVTSLFEHGRIVTTKQKAKYIQSYSEKLITRAKKSLELDPKSAALLHNKRVVMKTIKNRDIVSKLFDDIAKKSKDRKGGYTRIYLLGLRPGDAAEKAIIELVDYAKGEEATTEA